MTALLDTARAALDHGICVIPAATSGTKQPWPDTPKWDEYKAHRPTLDQVERWFGNGRYDGLGFVGGAVSGGLELLEIEGTAAVGGMEDALWAAAREAGLGELLERISDGYQEDTPSGGVHWLYRCDETACQKLALRPGEAGKVETLIETKGEGGFMIVAPSGGRTHPTGRSWELLLGDISTIATITPDERTQLHRLCRTFDRMPDRTPTPSPALSIEERLERGEGTSSGVRPGDEYNDRTTWDGILVPRGWVKVYEHGDEIAWRRPGKDIGISATTNHTGTDRLKVFSTSTPFDTEITYDRFGAYALLEHGGDLAAAARDLAGVRRIEKSETNAQRAAVTTNPPVSTPAVPTAPTAPTPPARVGNILADGFSKSEVGNADRFVAASAGRARYVHAWGRWIVYDDIDGVWRIDFHDALVTELAKQVAPAMFRQAVTFTGDARDDLWKWAQKSESASALRNMITLARAIPGVLVKHTDLDAQPWLLNVLNGTIDLRTGRLRRHSPDDLLTVQAPTLYDPEATAPLWEACLERWQPDPTMRAYLQQIVGTGATGQAIEHLFVNLGPGGNGKSKFYGAVAHVLGDYVVVPHKSLITVQKHEQHDTIKARLFGARLAIASETDASDRLDEAKVKELTGSDLLEARRMREDPWQFRPSHTMVMHTNHRPTVRGVDEGVWRRIRLIPWNVSIPLVEQDDHLAEKLQAESSGILNWILAGVAIWRDHGFTEPSSVAEATAGYRASQDSLAAFLDEYTRPVEGHQVATRDLVDAYERWCETTGEPPLNPTAFGRALTDRGFALSKNRRHRIGLRLVFPESDDTPESEQPSDLHQRAVRADSRIPPRTRTHEERTGEPREPRVDPSNDLFAGLNDDTWDL